MPDFTLKYKIMQRSDGTYDVVEMIRPDVKEFIAKYPTWEAAAERVTELGGEVPRA